MKVGKPKSKRVPVRLRQKIQKASSAKQRKDRKLAKKNPEWRSKLKKDPGIPNLFPYKDKILHEIEETKRRKEEDVLKRREDARARRQGGLVNDEVADAVMAGTAEDDALLDFEDDDDGREVDEAMGDTDSNPMAALLASAKARAQVYDHQDTGSSGDEMESDTSADDWNGAGSTPEDAAASGPRRDSSRKAFDKAFKQVISSSDVILYVLDARDPIGTRSPETEATILAYPDKRLILILNKIDLVPAPVLAAWLTHLRRIFPTLPLRAASSAAPNAKIFDHRKLTAQATAVTLLKALKSYSATRGLKRATSVGIIGYPNVGKSSVINALAARLGARNAPAPTGAEAGVTTATREVKLDSKLKLIDSPGIVFPSSSINSKSSKTDEQARLILLNAVPPKEIIDPVPAVSLLLRRLSSNPTQLTALLELYNVPALLSSAEGDPTTDFLVQVARKRGRLGKGGVPNLHAAAQTVVTDWRDGRIQGWVEAPPVEALEVAKTAERVVSGDQKQVVAKWAEEFKIEGLWGDGSGRTEA